MSKEKDSISLKKEINVASLKNWGKNTINKDEQG